MNYENPWTYEGSPVSEKDVDNCVGFVYIIKNRMNGRWYVGKKTAKFIRTKTVNKKKKRVKVDSDWKDYYGSSDELKADVEKHGKHNFSREIIRFCSSKTEMSYYEAHEQFARGALLTTESYNSWIMVKVRKNTKILS